MKCEIEFLPVGEGLATGDAIVVRYGDEKAYELMLVDGGHGGTGQEVVSHLRRHFGPSPVLEHVVLTHSDAEHACGLRTVLEEIEVRNLWLHLPWHHADDARAYFRKNRWMPVRLRDQIRAEYDIISEIAELARAADCKISYPFAGEDIGPFTVLSPDRDTYHYLLPQFDRTPEPDIEEIQAADMWLGKETRLNRFLRSVNKSTPRRLLETWSIERLDDRISTSPTNESSVVLWGSFEKGNVLLTGDAGIHALTWAANNADLWGLPLQQFSFVQIPDHGNHRSVGPTILNRLLGDRQHEDKPPRFDAFVSAPVGNDRIPDRMVLNAFRRRGARVFTTQGSGKLYSGGFPRRDIYSNADTLPFYEKVEDYA